MSYVKHLMRRMGMFAIMSTTAACGGAAPAGPVVNQGGGGGVAKITATPCPETAALEKLARTSWKKDGVNGRISVDCAALVVGGQTRWYLEGGFEPEPNDDWTVGLWSSLVTPEGETRWVEGDDEMPGHAMERGGIATMQGVDLDGDGSDELLMESQYMHGGHDESWLLVAKVTDDKVQIVTSDSGLALSSDNSAAVEDEAEIRSCNATQAVVAAGGAKHIQITLRRRLRPAGPAGVALRRRGARRTVSALSRPTPPSR